MNKRFQKNITKHLYELVKESEQLNPHRPQIKTISYNDIYKVIEENEIYQLKVELLNEELQKTNLRLEQESSRYIDLYDFIPFACFTLNQDGIVLEVNEAGADLFGIKKNNFINVKLLRYIAPNCHLIYLNHFQQAMHHPYLQRCEVKLFRKNGPLFDAEIDIKRIINTITHEVYLLVFIRDINHFRDSEENHLPHLKNQTITANINSVDKLADIISYECNQPLAVITNYLNGSIRRLESGVFEEKEIIKALKCANDQTNHLCEVILKMKNFTCRSALNYEKIDINQVINEAIVLINHENLIYPVTICYYPIKNPPPIFLDKIHIQQVIINLARNAIEAMHDAGCTTPKIFIETNYINTKIIEISIIDNGPGIKGDQLHKLFNPYFTTKTYGTGLGLAVCRQIIELHGGILYADSENHPLGGACFKFTLLTQSSIDKVSENQWKLKTS